VRDGNVNDEVREEEQRKFYNWWGASPEGNERASNLKVLFNRRFSETFIGNWFIENALNKKALDYGCGSSGQQDRKSSWVQRSDR